MDEPAPDAPDDGPTLTPIKSNAKRTVYVESVAGAPVALVKRFHAPGLSRLRDWLRARGEADALEMARSCRLPVPAVLALNHDEGGWSLRLEWIEGAKRLDEVLEAGAHPHVRRTDLARRIGALVADCERVGMRHPDPHPGNVLVDADGKLWLIDLARVRFWFADPIRFRRMLVVASARIRESTSERFRALVFRSFLRQHRVATQTPDPHAIEAAARIRQRRDVERRVDVWCRTSSATAVDEDEAGRQTVRVRAAGDEPAAGWRVERIEGDRDAVRAIWSTAVRATLHGIPSARPRRVALQSPCFVELDVPIDAAPARNTASIARLEELLADRGLVVIGDLFEDESGTAHVGVRALLEPLEETVD
ncbi:MAG: lipopolysaccharide kinase InaA family protein [Planctomycetota bacterium]